MTSVKCPKCGNLISGVQAGQAVKCPKCGYVMKLSGTSSAAVSGAGTASYGGKDGSAPLATWKWCQVFYPWCYLSLFLFSHVPQVWEMLYQIMAR